MILATPEQIPILKYRYGDCFYDSLRNPYESNSFELTKLRPMALFYFSPAEKYANFQTYAFNIAHCMSIYKKAIYSALEFLGPSQWFICLPWIVINPEYLYQNYSGFVVSLRQCIKERKNFEFMNTSSQELPEFSHKFIRWNQAEEKWKEVKKLIANNQKTVISNMKLSDFILPNENPFYFRIPDEEIFDLRSWKEYLRALNKFEEQTSEDSLIFGPGLSRLQTNTPNLSKLVHFEDLQILNDLSFNNINVRRNFVKDYSLWKKKRLKRNGRQKEMEYNDHDLRDIDKEIDE